MVAAMSVEAPERIWAYPSNVASWQTAYASDREILGASVYVRADKLEELAAALRVAQGNTDAAIEDYNEVKAALAEKDREIAELKRRQKELEVELSGVRRSYFAERALRNAGGKNGE